MNELEPSSQVNEEHLKSLVYFGLKSEEASVYLSLLKRGDRGEVVGRLKEEVDIGRTTIYAIMERLTEKNWVLSEQISTSPNRKKYIAKPPYKVMNDIIQKKEEELKRLKQESLFIGDFLEKMYQGAKKLTLETIHPGAYKYLNPLVKKQFKIKSEVIEHVESLERLSYDYELKGPKGFPKDCGLIIFEYHNKMVENDQQLIEEAIKMFQSKTEYEIRKDKIPGFQDVILEPTTIKNFYGFDVFIKLKWKKRPWLAGREAIIPIQNKIFLIHGGRENFKILMETILDAEKFHHLV